MQPETRVTRHGRTQRPAWVEAEYERIGRERDQASREADRVYRRELVRLCVGIEDIRDILADLNQAIQAANGHTCSEAAGAAHVAK